MVDCNFIFSLTHGAIDFVPAVPEALANLVLLNSKVNYAEGVYGKMMLQKLEFDDFTIHYNIYNIQTRFLMHVNGNSPGLMMHIALKNDLHYHLNSIGDVHLKEGQFNFVYLPYVDGEVNFEQAGEYRAFRIYFPEETLRQYAATFPYLDEFLQQVTGSTPALLLKEHGWVSSEISYIINQLLQCTYDEEAVRKLYFDNLFKELLLLLLLQKQRGHLNGKRLMQSLYEARSIIQKNPSRNFTITEVAQQVGLNASKLRTGFKQAFGTGVFQFMVAAKMQKAFAMILETDKPVKEIAMLTGYTSVQNFVTAFKNYFDATPGSLRKS